MILISACFLQFFCEIRINCDKENRGSEFSSYEFELRNRVTQNDVTLRFPTSKLKNKKLRFELLTRSREIESFTSSY